MEVINKIQRKILGSFSDVPESEHFYLAGGTALAEFYLRHRKSEDLDFFSGIEELIGPFSFRLEDMLTEKGMVVNRKRNLSSFVELIVDWEGETTMIHLAQDSPFRLESTRVFQQYPGLKVDNLIDLAANKLLALFGRASLRDFIDIYTLVERGKFTPEELMENAGKKDPGFDLYWLGVAFQRIKTFKEDSPGMLLLAEPIAFDKLRVFYEQWSAKIAEKIKPEQS